MIPPARPKDISEKAKHRFLGFRHRIALQKRVRTHDSPSSLPQCYLQPPPDNDDISWGIPTFRYWDLTPLGAFLSNTMTIPSPGSAPSGTIVMVKVSPCSPLGSRPSMDCLLTYTKRFVSRPANPIGSRTVQRPVSAS